MVTTKHELLSVKLTSKSREDREKRREIERTKKLHCTSVNYHSVFTQLSRIHQPTLIIGSNE